MFSLDHSMHYYLYPYPADMRKSFYTLSGIVTNSMGRNVQSGDVFIFLSRNLTVIKLLHMECGGLVIYQLKVVKKIAYIIDYYYLYIRNE